MSAMDPDWSRLVIEASNRATAEQTHQFCDLVYQAVGHITPEIAAILMQTFTAIEDYGTQESVVSTLLSADDDIRIGALLDEPPRLVKEAQDWAGDLAGYELDHFQEQFAEALRGSSIEVKDAFRHLTEPDDEFSEMFPNAYSVLATLDEPRT